MQPAPVVTSLLDPLTDITRARLRSGIRQHIARGDLLHIIDLSSVEQLDSPTLAELIRARRNLAEVGGMVALVAAQPSILRLLTVAGLDRIFTVFASRSEALAALSSTDLIPA
ncbi:MAG TPA: STAS domain-containing protein [Candidatus Acidoferrales bacterium]|nr:STAS domain-containing protein [Candidatus Acidoferrales bacterium]